MKNLIFFFAIILFNSKIYSQWQQTIGFFGIGKIYCLSANNSNVFAGTDIGGVYNSTNNGNSWDSINNGLPPINNSGFFSLAINGSKIFIGTTSGIYLTTNNGISWSLNYGLGYPYAFYISAFSINGNNILAGANNGIYISTNNGSSWVITSFTKTTVSLTFNNSDIFCGVQWTPYTGPYGIYKSTNYGSTWIDVNNGIPDSTTIYALAVCGNTIFAGGLYKSTNNGASWISSGNPVIGYCYAVSGSNIFAGGILPYFYTGLYLSTDTGSTWTDISNGLPANTYVRALAIHGQYIFAGLDTFGVWRRPLSDFGISAINEVPTDKNNINLFPNPVTDKLYIGDAGNCEVHIYNLFGELLLTKSVNPENNSIDMTKFAEGTYIVKVVSVKKVFTGKVFKINRE